MFQPVPGISQAVAVVTSGPHPLALLADGTMRGVRLETTTGSLEAPSVITALCLLRWRGSGTRSASRSATCILVPALADGTTIERGGPAEPGVPGNREVRT